MKGKCSVCGKPIAFYRQANRWGDYGPWLVSSHPRGRQYLCPGSHQPPLPNKRLPIGLLVVATIVVVGLTLIALITLK